MNYQTKSKLDVINKVLSVILVITFIALILVVTLYKGDEAVEVEQIDPASISIDVLTPGTYGGIQFDTAEDVADYYVQCYNYTKSLTAQYINAEGQEVTFYKMLADEDLSVENVLVEGKANSTINGLVPTIVGNLVSKGLNGMPPSRNRDPQLDVTDSGKSLQTSYLTADDILACNVVDNNDGTIDITIQPKSVILSMPGEDAQGHFFNVLGDISSTVNSIDMLSFSSGTIDENFVVNYAGGSGTVTIDTATGEIIKGNLVMTVHIDVQHANVLVIKDKSASLDITYKQSFPASDEYLMESKGVKRK